MSSGASPYVRHDVYPISIICVKFLSLVLFLCIGSVMSWGQTERIPRFYMFGEASASAYVLCHQTSTVLEFWARDRRRFGGSDGEFEGQSMSISD